MFDLKGFDAAEYIKSDEDVDLYLKLGLFVQLHCWLHKIIEIGFIFLISMAALASLHVLNLLDLKMNTQAVNVNSSLIWSVADLLRGDFKQSDYSLY